MLEPSCASVFRDELTNLFSKREDAQRLSEQVYLLSEFLTIFAPEFNPIPDTRNPVPALVQLHCHHQSVLNRDAEKSVLDRCGINSEVLSGGCCGMAGAFGFDETHYDLSIQIGERNVLPRIRATTQDQLIIADGFSCREHIEQATGRKTYHLAEALANSISAV